MGFFDSDSILLVLSIIEITLMILISLMTLIHIIFVGIIRRYRSMINVISIGYSFSAFIFCAFYLTYYGLTFHEDYYAIINVRGCTLLNYLSAVANGCVVYSSISISFNRLFSIVFYGKRFFRTGKWVIFSLVIHWFLSISIPFPYLVVDPMLCIRRSLPYWHRIYGLLTIIIIPTSLFGFISIVIFKFVRNSTNRIHADRAAQGYRLFAAKRDVQLVKKMLFMFLLFTIGWAPSYIFRLIPIVPSISKSRIDFGLTLLPVTNLVINMVILIYSNHQIRMQIHQRKTQRSHKLTVLTFNKNPTQH